MVPVDVAESQANPNVFAALMFAPVNLGKFGRAPSNPPCTGNINLRVSNATDANDALINAACKLPLYAVDIVGYPAAASCDASPR